MFRLLTGAMSSNSGVFGIVVTETFHNKSEMDKFIVAFQELADYIQKEEPDTLMYQLLVAEDNPLKTVLIDRSANIPLAAFATV